MTKVVSRHIIKRIRKRLQGLYGSDAEKLLERFIMMIGRYGVGTDPVRTDPLWSESDCVLITYADMVRAGDRSPLSALGDFCSRHLKGSIRTVHLLPFYPWSSDDGFSVIDYRKVHPEYGDWKDVQQLGKHFDLMFDLVLNHCSARSSWFKDFVAGIEPARHYFLQMDPGGDYSKVVRPRTSPLLTPTRTRDYEAHVWTTFSPDQVDLNWQNPDVLFEFLDILMLYLSMGMRIARLDAVAFLWKELGTHCIHLPQTHEVVKLFRDVLEAIAPQTILLTETNVPHPENVSYFGHGDEAQMVYQFSLPPLLLHGLATGDSTYLTKWAKALAPPPEGCTFFNFTASHDGIGVRPIEGILPEKEKAKLIRHVEKAGGKVSWRSQADGSKAPYELNITYYAALADADNPRLGAARFLCSQALMLSMRGIPGIYFHSLCATDNDLEGVAATGENRAINRRKWSLSELQAHLSDESTVVPMIFERYTRMLRRRANHPAFHPDAEQIIYDASPELFVLVRVARDRTETIVCVFNFTGSEQVVTNKGETEIGRSMTQAYDILSGKTYGSGRRGIKLAPYQALWLVPR